MNRHTYTHIWTQSFGKTHQHKHIHQHTFIYTHKWTDTYRNTKTHTHTHTLLKFSSTWSNRQAAATHLSQELLQVSQLVDQLAPLAHQPLQALAVQTCLVRQHVRQVAEACVLHAVCLLCGLVTLWCQRVQHGLVNLQVTEKLLKHTR